MQIPRFICIDTSIFDSQQFNLESREFDELKRHFPQGSLTILLPDPIKRELTRHISEHSRAAIAAIKKIRKDAPFVRKLETWTEPFKKNSDACRELAEKASSELTIFFEYYRTEHLDYAGVEIAKIMEWYDAHIPPFAPGNKRKEFPDALSIAILDRHFSQNGRDIAIISQDSDFEKACENRPHLFYFKSLSAYVAAEQAQQQLFVEWLELLSKDEEKLLNRAVSQDFEWFGFVLDEDWAASFSTPRIDRIELHDANLVDASPTSCRVAFSVTVHFSIEVEYDDYDTAVWDSEEKIAIPLHRIKTDVSSEEHITGVAEYSKTETSSQLIEVPHVSFDQDTIDVSIRPSWNEY